MKLSVVIPAHNEAGCIKDTTLALHAALVEAAIDHEIVVVNDNSKDETGVILKALRSAVPTLRPIDNTGPNGFGYAVRRGLSAATGDAIAVYMADASDTPEDLIKFYRTMVEKKVDCVFGTRFSPQSRVVDYPRFKLVLNRIVNKMIQIIFGLRYNDTTNAFKLYSRETIQGVQPLISPHFNLTVEIPLKAIVRGYSFEVVPNSWINRKSGVSKMRLREMGSRYLFIILYCLIERWLSCGDFKRKDENAEQVRNTVLTGANR